MVKEEYIIEPKMGAQGMIAVIEKSDSELDRIVIKFHFFKESEYE